MLASEKSVDSLQINSILSKDECESCVIRKMIVTYTDSQTSKALKPEDVIHTDLEFLGYKLFSNTKISLKFLDKYLNYL